MKTLKRYINKLKRFWLEPPDYALNRNGNIKSVLASDWREIIYIDVIIWLFLIASIHQVAFVFGRGAPTIFDYIKAIGMDASIWILSKALARSTNSRSQFDNLVENVTGYKRRRRIEYSDRWYENVDWIKVIRQSILWTMLIFFMVMSTLANVIFEMWAPDNLPGEIRFVPMGTPLEIITRLIGSGFLIVIVVAMTFVRMLRQNSMTESYESFNTTVEDVIQREDFLKKSRERSRRYRKSHGLNDRKAKSEALKRELRIGRK